MSVCGLKSHFNRAMEFYYLNKLHFESRVVFLQSGVSFGTGEHSKFKIARAVYVRSVTWKSGLASEALTRVLEHLEQNGQVLQNPHEISVNLAYSRFL